jgi:uncharacterized membrane protein YhaH (DUF805 family)
MKSKGRLKAWVKRILGLVYTQTQQQEIIQQGEHSIHSDYDSQGGRGGQGVRLARVPFFVFHVLVYTLTFFLLQIISTLLFSATGKAFTLSQFSFVLLVLLLSLIMLPVHIRRAHDIGWSMKHVLAWSITPAALRLFCLLIPLIVLLNQSLTAQLFGIMPFIGIVYWALMQIQLAFLVLLFFAPGTGHNRYGTYVARAFTLDNLYGVRVWKSRKVDKQSEQKPAKIGHVGHESKKEHEPKREINQNK